MDTRIGASAPQPPEGLVTTEGVNEGSGRSATESAETGPREPAERVTRGGRPEAADEQERESVRHDAGREVIVGPWGHRDRTGPSLEQSVEEQRARGVPEGCDSRDTGFVPPARGC